MKSLPQRLFTKRQLQVLHAIRPGHIIKNIRLLRKLSKMGVVKLAPETGIVVHHPIGFKIRAYYVDDAETFEIEGVGILHRKFFDGCFNPFLVRAEMDEKGRVKYY